MKMITRAMRPPTPMVSASALALLIGLSLSSCSKEGEQRAAEQNANEQGATEQVSEITARIRLLENGIAARLELLAEHL